MGQLLYLETCPVCNYNVEGELHVGNSTRARLFMVYRYVLASCHTCHNIVSVLTPTPDYDLPHILEAARRDLAQLEELAAGGDVLARQILPLHRIALEADEDDETLQDVETGVCTVCGGTELTLFPVVGGDNGEHFSDGTVWLQCPRCEEGQLWVRQVGSWDELGSGL